MEKHFIGLSETLIRALAQKNTKNWEFNIFTASLDGSNDFQSNLGLLVTINHGDTSMYLIGSTNQLGRQYQANYVLLWQAILQSKESGCKWFDIGGLNETTPKGIAHFKQGLQAKPYKLVGEWRGFFTPKLF